MFGSLIPTDGASEVVTTITGTVADAWPILAAAIGIPIMVSVIRRFL